MRSMRLLLPALLVVLFTLTGCMSDLTMNPAFPVTLDQARKHLDDMQQTPIALQRPVIVTAGFLDPGFISGNVARRIRKVTNSDAKIVSVSFFTALTFDACRDRLIDRVQREFPSDDPTQTIEVDVIGYSMGGLVARYAALPRTDGRHLRINRLFTISTPHRGARLASIGSLDLRARCMKSGSEFLASLDEVLQDAEFELVPYVRTRDAVIGEENAAPPGYEAYWVPNKPWSMSHNMAGADERIIADIARRLRDETPLIRAGAGAVPMAAKNGE